MFKLNFCDLHSSTQNCFENDENKYRTFSRVMIDAANDEVQEYSVEQANALIRKKFNAILGIPDDASRKTIRKAIRRHQVEVFEIMEETLENLLISGWGDNPFFQEYVENKNLADGDANEFYVADDTILTVSRFSGNHHNLTRQKLGHGESFSVTTDWYGIKIYDEFELFQAGRKDFAAMITAVYKAFDQKVNDMIYESFMSADEKLPTDLKHTAKLDATTKDQLVEFVQNLETDTGSEVVIIGTRAALSKIVALSDTAWISDEMKKERNTTGLTGYFEGIKLMVLPQVNEVGTRNKKLDNKKLIMMPMTDNKPIKLVNEGEAYVKQISDGDTNQDMTYEYEFMQKMGVNVVLNQLFGTWTIATA